MQISAEARVVACFTFIVALLLGAWSALDHLLAGPYAPLPAEFAAMTVTVIPMAVTALAFQATRSLDIPWARTMGGAAVLLGFLSSVGGVLYFLANTS